MNFKNKIKKSLLTRVIDKHVCFFKYFFLIGGEGWCGVGVESVERRTRRWVSHGKRGAGRERQDQRHYSKGVDPSERAVSRKACKRSGATGGWLTDRRSTLPVSALP